MFLRILVRMETGHCLTSLDIMFESGSQLGGESLPRRAEKHEPAATFPFPPTLSSLLSLSAAESQDFKVYNLNSAELNDHENVCRFEKSNLLSSQRYNSSDCAFILWIFMKPQKKTESVFFP